MGMQELTIRLTAAACGLASVRMLMFICSVCMMSRALGGMLPWLCS